MLLLVRSHVASVSKLAKNQIAGCVAKTECDGRPPAMDTAERDRNVLRVAMSCHMALDLLFQEMKDVLGELRAVGLTAFHGREGSVTVSLIERACKNPFPFQNLS